MRGQIEAIQTLIFTLIAIFVSRWVDVLRGAHHQTDPEHFVRSISSANVQRHSLRPSTDLHKMVLDRDLHDMTQTGLQAPGAILFAALSVASSALHSSDSVRLAL